MRRPIFAAAVYTPLIVFSLTSFACSLIAGVNGALANEAVEKSTPPNVILIVVDDMGWMDLSCQGSDYYKTPNIDQIAQEGMRFTNGYAA